MIVGGEVADVHNTGNDALTKNCKIKKRRNCI